MHTIKTWRRNFRLCKSRTSNEYLPCRQTQFGYKSTFGRQDIAGEVCGLCEQEQQRPGMSYFWCIYPKTKFSGTSVAMIMLPSNVCASETGSVDNPGISVLCGSSGEDGRSAWSIYVGERRAQHASYKVAENSKSRKARKKRRREQKGLEDYMQAADGTVYCMAQALQADWTWPPVETHVEFLNQKVTISFSPKVEVSVWLPCTERSAGSLPYILDKLTIFIEREWISADI